MDRRSLYKSIWQKNWPEFRSLYAAKYAKKYGQLTPAKIAEVQKLLACGDFSRGFHRYQCHDCQTLLILPFSCKSRLCLSCSRKKIFGWSVKLSQVLNTALQHQHITLTLPGRLRDILFERNFRAVDLNKLAALLYQREVRKLKKSKRLFMVRRY